MTLTGENRSTKRKSGADANLSTTINKCAGQRLNQDILGEGTASNTLGQGTAFYLS
jgi:hypothetical protein